MERQRRFGQRFVIQFTVHVALPNYGEGLAPVALAAEQPVAQFVINGLLAQTAFIEPLGDFILGFPRRQPGEKAGVDRGSIVREANRLFPFGRLDDQFDREIEFCGERQIALVMRRNSHNRARSVGGQNVVGDPNGNALVVDGIDGIRAREHAGLILGEFGAFEIALFGDLGLIRLYGGGLFGSGDVSD